MHIHVVKRGDTLSSIAAMHDALPAFVAADNGLTLSTPLVIGQALVVRTPKTLHTVRAGETLSSIARDYDLSVRTLLRRNFFLHGRELLREGDVLAQGDPEAGSERDVRGAQLRGDDGDPDPHCDRLSEFWRQPVPARRMDPWAVVRLRGGDRAGRAAGAGGLPRAGADAAVREKLYLKKYWFLRLFIESESAIIRVFFGREVP